MSAADVPSQRPVTGGAWLAAATAANAALSAAVSLAPLALVSGSALFVRVLDDVAARSDAGNAPPEFGRLVDLWLELGSILRPYAHATAAMGTSIAIALFVAACGFLVGSERARRAVRVLLVLDAMRWIVAVAWFLALQANELQAWQVRYREIVEKLLESVRRVPHFVPDPHLSWIVAVLPALALGTVGVGLIATLFTMAGRASARAWCSARRRR